MTFTTNLLTILIVFSPFAGAQLNTTALLDFPGVVEPSPPFYTLPEASTIEQPLRGPFCWTDALISAVLIAIVCFCGDDELPLQLQEFLGTAEGETEAPTEAPTAAKPTGIVQMKVRQVPVEQLDDRFQLEMPQLIQDAYLVTPEFGSAHSAMAHPDRCLLYVHYLPEIDAPNAKPRITFRYADREARHYDKRAEEEDSAIEWDFAIDLLDAATYLGRQPTADCDFYAVQRIRIRINESADTTDIGNSQAVIFKVHRGKRSESLETPKREKSLLKRLGGRLRNVLRGTPSSASKTSLNSSSTSLIPPPQTRRSVSMPQLSLHSDC
ncbi:unnamed protein product, partial [Mesorhabditis spiculigera]